MNLEFFMEAKMRVTLSWNRERFHLLGVLARSETSKEEDCVFILLKGKAESHGKGERSIRDDTIIESVLDLFPSRIFHQVFESGICALRAKLAGQTLFQPL